MSMDRMHGVEANVDEARYWAQESLEGGSAVAECLRKQLDRFTDAQILGPVEGPAFTARNARVGRQIDSDKSDLLAGEFMRDMRNYGGVILLVEDDLWTKHDGDLSGEAAFVGDTLIRWTRLDASYARAAKLLRSGASGYPTNAYVSSRDETSLQLKTGWSLSAEQVSALCSSTLALVVAAFDAEAWLALRSG